MRELDGLIAILESHFNYEERRLAKALDTVGPLPWSADVFAPGQDRAQRSAGSVPDNSKKRGALATCGVILAGLRGEGTVRSR